LNLFLKVYSRSLFRVNMRIVYILSSLCLILRFRAIHVSRVLLVFCHCVANRVSLPLGGRPPVSCLILRSRNQSCLILPRPTRLLDFALGPQGCLFCPSVHLLDFAVRKPPKDLPLRSPGSLIP